MNELEIQTFKTPEAWEAWLEKHYDYQAGIWVRLFKKASGVASLNYAQALDVALCYGWIDGQVKSYDEKSWIQKFTPRRPRSLWSKRNTEHVARLTKLGRMKPSGIAEVERAKADGRWQGAYATPSTVTMPKDFLTELEKYPRAQAFFATLNKSNTYAIAWRLQTAKKPETRERRMKKFIEMLNKGKKLY